MSRVVTADHVLFDECSDAFRREQEHYVPFDAGDSRSFLLTAFNLDQDWDLTKCTVRASIQVHLPGAYSAFISMVENPKWVGRHNSHLFGIALAAVVSFISGRPCKSTRDDYLCRYRELSDDKRYQLALLNPILTAGPGCTHISLSTEMQKAIESEVKDFIARLHSIPYSKYRSVMQALRLVHLSLINKRDDFGLGFLLLVSAIESIAQKAIKRDKVKIKNPLEAQWKRRAREDTDFGALLKDYLEARGKNKYLKERFIRFVHDYSPVKEWEQYVPYPMQDFADYIKNVDPSHNIDYIVRKNWFEKYPNELNRQEIDAILADAYTYRSYFIHRGEQPPHRHPSASLSRFFQEYFDYTEAGFVQKILPNYELLLGIAKHSILNWVNASET